MSGTTIVNGMVLVGSAFEDASVVLDGPLIAGIGAAAGGTEFDAAGCLVLPGIVDVHGDAFERQIMPRPKVQFDLSLALLETDRQLVANGITTGYHGVTWSWEPGLRDGHNARGLLRTLEELAPHLTADTRYHLRHETYNLDAEGEILDWIAMRRIGCIAFNDHMTGTIKERHRPDKIGKMRERTGLSEDDFQALIDRVYARRDEVPASIERLARAAVAAGIPALSHDDMSPEMRAWHRSIGCTVAEFPIDEPTTEAAAAAGDPIVFGAPNVVRGGSHTGCPSAAEMAGRGLCDVLASDYYYPALPYAPVLLARAEALTFEDAWSLVSTGPARAMGLTDRGTIGEGLRADIVVVRLRDALPPAIVATFANGRMVHYAG